MEVKLAEDGEILVRGGNVMVGYYKEPGAPQIEAMYATPPGGHAVDTSREDG